MDDTQKQASEQRDRTPEWVQGCGIIEALGNIAYDIGQEAARLTMLQQRVTDLILLVQEKKQNADTERKRGSGN